MSLDTLHEQALQKLLRRIDKAIAIEERQVPENSAVDALAWVENEVAWLLRDPRGYLIAQD